MKNFDVILDWIPHHTIGHPLIFIHWLVVRLILLICWLVIHLVLFILTHHALIILIHRALITTLYIDFYNSLKYTSFIFAWKLRLYYFFWKNISLNESFWKPKISFTKMFHESFEKHFNWSLMSRYSMKLN